MYFQRAWILAVPKQTGWFMGYGRDRAGLHLNLGPLTTKVGSAPSVARYVSGVSASGLTRGPATVNKEGISCNQRGSWGSKKHDCAGNLHRFTDPP
jgi:hypothetical protein